jgi:hypothetical protein
MDTFRRPTLHILTVKTKVRFFEMDWPEKGMDSHARNVEYGLNHSLEAA